MGFENFKYHYIYKITNIITNRFYIGSRSTNIDPILDKYFGSGIALKSHKTRGHNMNKFIEFLLIGKDVNRLSGIYTIRNYNLFEHQYLVTQLFKYFAELENVSYDLEILDIIMGHDLLENLTRIDLPYPIKNFNENTKKCWNIIEQELIKDHKYLIKYSDEHIKNKLTDIQFSLFKYCDILDLWIFIKQEQSLGNNCLKIKEVEENCFKILNKIDYKFSSIDDFLINFKL